MAIRRERLTREAVGYVWAAVVVVACTAIGFAMRTAHSELANIIMVYLLGVVLISARFEHGPSMAAAILGVAAFDFFFVPPYVTFEVGDLRYLVTFAIMLVVGLLTSGLTARIRREVEDARRAHLRAETEQLQSALLSSVSHDLRTPLAAISGAASTLLSRETEVDDTTRRELLHTIYDEGERLNRLVRNLLDMTRLQSGALRVRKEWLPLEEVVGTVLTRLELRLAGREVTTSIPGDMLVAVDATLLEQLLMNLVENALKYAPPDRPIELRAFHRKGAIVVEVADRGPGFPAGAEARVFDKFYRAPRVGSSGGVGLGLAICRAIVVAHGGVIEACNRAGGGAVVRFTLPVEGAPPHVQLETPASADA